MCILTISVCQGEDAPNNQTIQKAEIGVIDLNRDVVQCILKDNFLYVLGHDSISKYLITDNDLKEISTSKVNMQTGETYFYLSSVFSCA